MPNTFHLLAEELLQLGDYTFYTGISGAFGFEYKRDYRGRMARRAKRPKQGFFDIVIKTGTRYGADVTHRMSFEDLIQHSNVNNCFRVWRGEDPRIIGATEDEKEALVTLCLLMFEQEVNWGTENWQKSSHFYPRQRTPQRIRPRDMIMGFVRQAFELGIDNVKFWYRINPGTACFSNPEDANQSDYGNYPLEYKRYFTELENEDMGGTSALMVEDFRRLFKERVRDVPNNPAYIPERQL